jgi:chorismate synthase
VVLRYLTAGESHGPQLTTILEGLPARLPLLAEDIDGDLARRQRGFGRGGRMQIERDRVRICAGVRHGLTLGSPLALVIENRDWENWRERMAVEPVPAGAVEPATRPRPGHADLTGALKYGHADVRNVLERASARETTARVAVGAACKRLLGEFGIRVYSHVVEIGGIAAADLDLPPAELFARAEASPVRCADPDAAAKMMERIAEAGRLGTSVGGVVEVLVEGAPPGLGSYVHWDRKLDARLARAVMSIQAFKGVEVGLGFETARRLGRETLDEIYAGAADRPAPFVRKTNRAGGIEGGMTNGEVVVVRGAMKPLSTQRAPLASVDLATGQAVQAGVERTDVCAVPAAGVVAEAVVAFEVADALAEKCGGDSLDEMRRNYDGYLASLRRG